MHNNLAAPRRLVAAHAAEKVVTKWWEKETPNMRSIDGTQELVDALVGGPELPPLSETRPRRSTIRQKPLLHGQECSV
jgi:hypothetical protein